MNFGFGTQKQPQPLSLNADRPRWKQVHGIAVAEVVAPSQECGEVDALWTRMKNYPLGIVTADCVPLLLKRKDDQAVGVIHSGWRGTHARILEAFFKALPDELSNPKDWQVWIGPAIQACCYEVSEELIENFIAEFSELGRKKIEPTHRMLDLIAVNRSVCEMLGLEIKMIHPDCTFCTKEADGSFKYFSYRRGDRLSRQYSMIEL
jgi:YfiH family protein